MTNPTNFVAITFNKKISIVIKENIIMKIIILFSIFKIFFKIRNKKAPLMLTIIYELKIQYNHYLNLFLEILANHRE